MGTVNFRKVDVDGIKVFYREAGPKDAPAILLLQGFPTAGHMFRDLIPQLADRFRLIAPDLPGFGQSDMPTHNAFTYTFENIANVIDRFTEVIGLHRFAMYVFDYGAPVGFRLAVRHPDRVTALISQNGNAYEEGLSAGWNPIRAYWQEPSEVNREALRSFLAPETTRWQYTQGVPDVAAVSPDGYSLDNFYLARPGADEIQLDLFGDYKATSPFTRPSKITSVRTSRASWRCGERTIPSSCRRGPKPSNVTFPTRWSISSTRATLPSRPMLRRSRQ
jgi:pimeloyl-ACP methyl ester carboxylesterase